MSYALSELSGGVADEISLNAVKNNPENFWKVLLAYYNQVKKWSKQIIKKYRVIYWGQGHLKIPEEMQPFQKKV